MNGELDSFYLTMGLKPGASPTEIKAAYRHLAKLYHPDRDQSLDAEVKYKEIRIAYEKLRDWYLAGRMAEPSDTDCGSPERTPQAYKDWRSERTIWTSADWATEYDIDLDELVHGIKKTVKLIPFSLTKLPVIFLASLKELANVGVVLQVILAAFFISVSYGPDYVIDYSSVHNQSHLPYLTLYSRVPGTIQDKPYKNLVRIIGLTSGLAAVVLRYYVTLRHKGVFFYTFILFSFSTAVMLFIRRFYPKEDSSAVLACFFIASIILVLNPLGNLSESLGFILRNLQKQKCDGK